MVDRSTVRRRVQLAANKLTGFGRELDRTCARMNNGLAAIAIALAVITVLTAAVKLPALLSDGSSDAYTTQDNF
ncbi:MAG TPA: hypothetical protein VL993_17875 [Stellaceae bacterium]|nr:hypothetical protein [Stellaceae bacterium]